MTPAEKYSVAYRAAYEAVYRSIIEASLRELSSPDGDGPSVRSALDNGWFDNVVEDAEREAAFAAESAAKSAASRARDEAGEEPKP